jgi:hypothetical protein
MGVERGVQELVQSAEIQLWLLGQLAILFCAGISQLDPDFVHFVHLKFAHQRIQSFGAVVSAPEEVLVVAQPNQRGLGSLIECDWEMPASFLPTFCPGQCLFEVSDHGPEFGILLVGGNVQRSIDQNGDCQMVGPV